MPVNTQEYYGYLIHWDVSEMPNGDFWTAEAAIFPPASSLDVPNVHLIPGDRFSTVAEAEDYIVRAAKQWVDSKWRFATPAGS
jgi:hypothetical protein